MAFNGNNKNIQKMMEDAAKNAKQEKAAKQKKQQGQRKHHLTKTTVDLSNIQGKDTVKTYGFTLEPAVKAKLDQLAKEHNFKTTSPFLNELIKNGLEEPQGDYREHIKQSN